MSDYSKSISSFFSRPLGIGVIVLLLFIISFPALYPEMQPGLDPSYVYALNYIAATDMHLAQDMMYTYGPLGFLKHPLPLAHNLELGILCLSVLRFAFLFLFIYLARVRNKQVFISSILALIISFIIGFDQLIFGIVAIVCFLHYEKKKNSLLAINSFIIAFSLLVKINIGIIGGLIFFSYLVFDLIKNKNIKGSLIAAAAFIVSFLALWLITIHSFAGITNFIRGVVIFSSGNSGAFSINPENNWIILSMFFIVLISVPILEKDKIISLAYIIFALAFFAVFKYSFARQENYHIQFFVDFLYLFIFLVLIAAQKVSPRLILLLFMALFLFCRNIYVNGTYTIENKIQLDRYKNFFVTFFDFSTYKKMSADHSEQNLKSKILPEPMLRMIGNATVDCFPWDLSYIAANRLTYRPRPMIQSGCLYTPVGVDSMNAAFISSAKAAVFMIWDLEKPVGELLGLDGRYILNSDAGFLYELLNNYEIVAQNNSVLLFKKAGRKQLEPVKTVGKSTGILNEWIDVPETNTGVMRLKAEFSKTLTGKLKAFFYKEMEYYLDYKNEEGTIHTHRIYFDNASSGLWINPYINQMAGKLKGEKTVQVRFYSADKMNVLDTNIDLVWEHFSFSDSARNSDIYFSNTTIFSSVNDLEKNYPCWKTEPSALRGEIVKSGKKSFRVNSEVIYSATFEASVKDIIENDSAYINISVNAYLTELNSDINIVYEVTRDGKNVKWQAASISKQVSKTCAWEKVHFNNIDITGALRDDVIKIYVWNPGKKVAYLDDFKVDFLTNR